MSAKPQYTPVIIGSGPPPDGAGAIPALEQYTGTVHYTDARTPWDGSVDARRVAVLGDGAEAVRIVPELAQRARSVKVFQHSPEWILPDPRYGRLAKLLLPGELLPGALCTLAAFGTARESVLASVLEGIAHAYLRASVADPWLRRRLTPCARLGGTRVLISNEYYRAVQQPNCKLITWPVYAVSSNGVRSAEGIEHEVDCIVVAGEQAATTRRPADRTAVTR